MMVWEQWLSGCNGSKTGDFINDITAYSYQKAHIFRTQVAESEILPQCENEANVLTSLKVVISIHYIVPHLGRRITQG